MFFISLRGRKKMPAFAVKLCACVGQWWRYRSSLRAQIIIVFHLNQTSMFPHSSIIHSTVARLTEFFTETNAHSQQQVFFKLPNVTGTTLPAVAESWSPESSSTITSGSPSLSPQLISSYDDWSPWRKWPLKAWPHKLKWNSSWLSPPWEMFAWHKEKMSACVLLVIHPPHNSLLMRGCLDW